MSEPYVGEIRMFAGNFAPRGWAFCDGQLLTISSYEALFSLLGTIYGGDGSTTFGLPDLRGRIPMHAGNGPGLTNRTQGQKSGTENVSLTINQLPAHNHAVIAANQSGNNLGETPVKFAAAQHKKAYNNSGVNTIPLNGSALKNNQGGGQSHDNMMPFQCIHYIISLFGIYPSRS